MTSPRLPESQPCGSSHCITCGDDGIAMTVHAIDPDTELAVCVDEQGDRFTVETALVAPVATGSQLLVHAGTAIATLAAPAAGERP